MITRIPKNIHDDLKGNIFKGNIEELTLQNENYRKVLNTTTTQQLVVMNIIPLQDIGMETHPNTTQFIRVESGECDAILNGEVFKLKDNDAIVIPPGTEHNIINTSNTLPLKLYTIYSPPEHKDGTVQHDKPKESDDDENSEKNAVPKHSFLEEKMHHLQNQLQTGGCGCDGSSSGIRFRRIYNLNRQNYKNLSS